MIEQLGNKLQLALQLLRKKPVVIDLFGDDSSRAAYDAFMRRHGKLPFMRAKTFGVALLKLPGGGEKMFSGKAFQAARTNRNRAIKAGYVFRRFDAPSAVDMMMAVHRSADVRQGKPIGRDYTDRAAVTRYCGKPGPWFGVFDRDDVLRAYCHAPIIGDSALLSRIMGDDRSLSDGVVWFLVWETAIAMQAHQQSHGYPHWLMYDTYVGAAPGLQEFKRRLGFKPHRVHWRWLGVGRSAQIVGDTLRDTAHA